MSVYLIENIRKYRCDTEEEALQLIEEAKQNPFSIVKKVTNEAKELKSTEDEWKRVEIKEVFTDEKNPIEQIEIIFERK